MPKEKMKERKEGRSREVVGNKDKDKGKQTKENRQRIIR
jgi:hypothetical protein